MPWIFPGELPEHFLNHLKDRYVKKEMPADEIEKVEEWLASYPEVSDGLWCGVFQSGWMIVGKGIYPETILKPGNTPYEGSDVFDIDL
jgi:hypothetical protein